MKLSAWRIKAPSNASLTVAKRHRKKFLFERRVVVASALLLVSLFMAVNLQIFETWRELNKTLGDSSPTQSWLERKLMSFSLDTYDMFLSLRRLEAMALRHSLGQISTETLDQHRRQVIGNLFHFQPGSMIERELRGYDTYTTALQSANAFVASVSGLQDGSIAIEEVLELADQATQDWAQLNGDAVSKEWGLRDGMEKTIKAFKPLAQNTYNSVAVLSSMCAIAFLVAVFAVWKLVTTERRRFERFELLVASVGHDLRSPLQAIQSAGSLLGGDLKDEDRLHYANIVKASTKTLSRLVGDILQIVRREQLSEHKQAVNLKRWFSQFSVVYEEKAKRKNLRWTSEIEADNAIVELDPDRLTQCVGNLVENAIRYTAVGYVEVRAFMSELDAGHSFLTFEVSDTGQGIAKANFKRIFEPFERASRLDSGQGMGLGLSIVFSIVSAANGTVELKSEVGSGSTFIVRIPVRVLPAEADPHLGNVLSDSTFQASVVPSLYTQEVLVVDDDSSILQSVCGVLEKAGYATDRATNGIEAMAKLKTSHYRLLLTDVQMPLMDGFELAQFASGLPRKPFVIAMTAHTEDLQNDPRSGLFDSVLTKVFTDEDLFDQVEVAFADSGF